MWTSARLSAYLAERTGVRIAPSWLRTLLGRQDFVCGRPTHALGHLQDPAEEAAFEAALAARGDWLQVIWLPRYSPNRNRKEREWRRLKRDARGHLAGTLRAFIDEILAGLRRLGGTRLDIVDAVPDWFIAGHRKPPTGRPPGRPKGATDSYKRAPYR